MSTVTSPPHGLEQLEADYRSGAHTLDRDFFQPCLSRCVSYERAVGYFTSYALAAWTDAISRMLTEPAIAIRLVVGPVLLDEDKTALLSLATEDERMAYRQGMADSLLDETIESLRAGADAARLRMFCWLVATDKVKIRFAFPAHVPDADLYHEKFGIFHFPNGARVAFTGSANETTGGYRQNFEYVDVFRSWIAEDLSRIHSKSLKFENTWDGSAPGLIIRGPSARVLDRIRSMSNDNRGANRSAQRWVHQDEAIAAFLARKRGILEMATGTGKTRTAIRIANNLLESAHISGAIISTAGNDLLDQWGRELKAHSELKELVLYRHYGTHHDIGRFTLHPGGSTLLCSRQALPELRRSLREASKGGLLIIHDEVHGFGSPLMRRELSGFHAGFPYVLGLSATPEREYDQAGNEFIEQEIGPVIFRFGLDEAIRNGILCPFKYIQIPYRLTDDDRNRLRQVYGRKAAAELSGQPWPEERTYRELSLVYKTAEEKPARFREMVRQNQNTLQASIVFVETKAFAELFLDTVGFATTAYSTYFDDDPSERLKELSEGDLDCLVCCKRISEGIDIPHLKNVILVSADRGRLQTIQRIGRTLRRDPLEPRKVATVLDYVWTDAPPDHSDAERAQWLKWLSTISPKKSVMEQLNGRS